MEKFATNIDEQITKLESRGMTFADKEKAKECLLDIGYFRLGFYWFPFEKTYPRKVNRTHEVKALFDNMPDDIVKSIILQNSGFQLAKL